MGLKRCTKAKRECKTIYIKLFTHQRAKTKQKRMAWPMPKETNLEKDGTDTLQAS